MVFALQGNADDAWILIILIGEILPPLKVTIKKITDLLVRSNYVNVAGGIDGVLHYIGYKFQDDA